MAIANRTTAEVQTLKRTMTNTLKLLELYDSDSRNPQLAAGVDTALTALNVQVDATIADAAAAADFPQAAT